jgi:hypothetical protein
MTAPLEVLSTSVQVMGAGTTMSPEVMQFLASEVATAASRERDRRITVTTLGGVACVAAEAWSGSVPVLAGVAGTALCVLLTWGVRNRALLDRCAHDAAIAPAVLVQAVRLVRSGVGPSTALREALLTSSPTSGAQPR